MEIFYGFPPWRGARRIVFYDSRFAPFFQLARFLLQVSVVLQVITHQDFSLRFGQGVLGNLFISTFRGSGKQISKVTQCIYKWLNSCIVQRIITFLRTGYLGMKILEVMMCMYTLNCCWCTIHS